MKKVLCAATIGDLDDGAAKVSIDQAIASALRDLEERGQDEKPRKVVMTLVLEKTESGLVECHLQVICKAPPVRTGGVIGKIETRRGQAQLLFSPENPSDPDQGSLDFPKE
jgi:hypothetical protein